MTWNKNQVWDGTFNICHNFEGVYLLHIIPLLMHGIFIVITLLLL